MKMDKLYIITFMMLILVIITASGVFAEDLSDDVSAADEPQIIVNDTVENDDSLLTLDNRADDAIMEDSEEIIVNNWTELRDYCSLDDKNYVLKLKENTNYYPEDSTSDEYQIVIKNNVTIKGSSGAYIGDSSPNARNITYAPIKVNDNSGIGITIENVTFKWISTSYQTNGVFLTMGGNVNNTIKDCNFYNITTSVGHSSILHIKYGTLFVNNCAFVNCTTDFGCISVYSPKDDPTKTCTGARMDITDSYFEGNYAKTEPGCINNCGILNVYNITFYKNSAFWWAGAIHTHGGANTTIYQSNFTDNLAGWNGGALYTYSYLQIYNSTFVGNNCTTNNGGGAIGACKYLHSPEIYIDGCLFKDNENLCWGLTEESTSGTGRGGAISIMDTGNLEVYNTRFIQNAASIGTAICAIASGNYGSPNIKIIGNEFFNHTRIGDVLRINVDVNSECEIRDNYYYNNSIEFSKLKLDAGDPVDGTVTFYIDPALKNPKSYDDDILQRSLYDVYVDDVYNSTISGLSFVLNIENGETHRVYVVPSISNSQSNEVLAGKARTYIYVSQKYGKDTNDGLTRDTPVATLNKSIELARLHENIIIMDGTFNEINLTIDYNLTITGENGATITSKGPVFKIADGNTYFININFKNSKLISAATERLINQVSKGILSLQNCTFEGNEYRLLIYSEGIFEGNNLKFISNDAGLIKYNSITISNSLFESNIAIKTNYESLILPISSKAFKLEIEDSVFRKNTVVRGCIKVNSGSSAVTGCNFESNIVSGSSSRASAIYNEGGTIIIKSSIFNSNKDLGTYSSVIYAASGTTSIQDSIIINNSYENNKGVINGATAGLKAITCNHNWWGNTLDNLEKPTLHSSVKCDNWLVLNTTSSHEVLGIGEVATVLFDLNYMVDSENNISNYFADNLPSFDLSIQTVNGNSVDKVSLVNSRATVPFELIEFREGSLIASYENINVTMEFYVTQIDPNFIINVSDITVGETANINVTTISKIKSIIMSVDGNNYTLNFVDGVAHVSIPDLSCGMHEISIDYAGSGLYYPSQVNKSFEVLKIKLNFNIDVADIAVGETANINVTTNSNLNSVDMSVDGNNYTLNFVDGVAHVSIPDLSCGMHEISIDYAGSSSYYPSQVNKSFEVFKIEPTISIDVNNVYNYGDEVKIVLNINDDATGSINLTYDNNVQTKEIINGKVEFIFTNLKAGNYTIKTNYSGDAKYLSKENAASFTINKYDSTTELSVGELTLGENAVLTVMLKEDATGNVTFIINGENHTVNVNEAKAVYTIENIAKGDYSIEAIYNGDDKYLSSRDSTQFSVGKLNSSIELMVSDIYYGDNVTVEITVIPTATGRVTVNIDGKSKTVDLINSKASVYIPNLGAGNKEVTVSYSGDEDYLPSTNSTAFKISKADSSFVVRANSVMVGENVVVSIDFNADMTGKFTYVLGNESKTYTISKMGKVNDWVLENLKPGNYTVDVTYSGDNNYNVNLNSTKFTVSEYPTPQVSNEGIDVKNTDKSPFEGNVNGKIVYEIKLENNINGSMVIDANGNIYFACNNELFAYSSSGELIWNYSSNNVADSSFAGVTMGRDMLISPMNGDKLYFINITLGNHNDPSNMYQGSSLFSPVIDENFNIYIASEYQYSDDDYKLVIVPYSIWETSLEPTMISLGKSKPVYAPVIVDETHVAMVTEDGLKFIDISNGYVTTLNFISSSARPVVGIGGSIYAFSGDSIILVIDEQQQWKTKVTGAIGKYLALDEDMGYIYSVNGNGVLYKYDIRSGEESFVHDFKESVSSNILIDNDGMLYLGTESGKFYALDNEGNIAWKVNLNSTITGNPVMDSEGSVYVILNGSNIVKLTSGELMNANIDVNVDNITIGDNLTVKITFNGEITGIISVSGGIENITYISNDDELTLTVPDLSAGDYSATIYYSGDKRFRETSKTIKFSVFKKNIELNVDDLEIYEGSNAVYVLTLPDDVEGNVSVIINDKYNNGTVNNGKVRIEVSNLFNGTYDVIVKFNGDNKYLENKTTAKLKVLNKIIPKADDVIDIPQSSDDKNPSYSINLENASGNLTVVVDGVVYKTVGLVNGSATVVVNDLSSGSHIIEVIYSGDNKYSSISKKITVNVPEPVSPHVPVIKVVGSNFAMLYTSGAKYKVRVTSDGKAVVGKTVNFVINGKKAKATTDKNGYASVKISLPPKTGKYTVTATYNGVKATNKVTVKSILSAKNVNVKKSAKSLKIKVTLKKVNGKYLKSKKLTLKLNGRKYTAKTNKKGVATFKIAKNAIKKLKAGKKYTYKVTYLKDTTSKKITVKK